MSASNTLPEFNSIFGPAKTREGQLASPLENACNPTRLMACGTPEDVDSLIDWLQIKGLAQAGEWSPAMPSSQKGEVIRVLTRYYGSRG